MKGGKLPPPLPQPLTVLTRPAAAARRQRIHQLIPRRHHAHDGGPARHHAPPLPPFPFPHPDRSQQANLGRADLRPRPQHDLAPGDVRPYGADPFAGRQIRGGRGEDAD